MDVAVPRIGLLLTLTMAGLLAFGLGACGRGAAPAASRSAESPSQSAGAEPGGRPTAGVTSTRAARPLISRVGSLPELDPAGRTIRLPGWWTVVGHSDRFVAVNRMVAGEPSSNDLDGVREEHYLIDTATGAQRRVRRSCVAGGAWWSMARAVSDAGWLVWEEVRGQAEDRWRLYAASFARRTLKVGSPRLLMKGERRLVDRPHFALCGRRLVGSANSYDADNSWGSQGWVFVIDLATGDRRVLYRSAVSVGDLCAAAGGTVAFVEYTDPVDTCSARLVVVRIADGRVLLRHRYTGGPVRMIAWDGRTLAWEGVQDEDEGGYAIMARRADGTERLIHRAGIAPALSGGYLFFGDYAPDEVSSRVLAVRMSDWKALRLGDRGNVSRPVGSPRRTIVWTDVIGDDTLVRIGRLR